MRVACSCFVLGVCGTGCVRVACSFVLGVCGTGCVRIACSFFCVFFVVERYVGQGV